jgi:glycosyltransferase involved in cell wall biosynthesis
MAITTGKKRVLIVSFYFPPTNSVAAVRVGKFAKYLPQFGWEPIVLTADTAKDRPQTLPVEMKETNVFRTSYFALASSLYRNRQGNQVTPSETASRRFNWKEPFYRAVRLAQPIYTLSILAPIITDPMGWYPHAVKKGRELLNKYEIDAIFSSYAPSTSHLVACRLHQISGIPWIAEFEDLWSLNHNAKTTSFLRYLTCRLERRVMKRSSLLIAASEPAAEKLEKLHAKKAVTILNGFDEDDYVEDIPLTSKFTITYTGQIYPGKQDPTPLFKVLKELREEGKISPSNFEVRFFGGGSLTVLKPLIERYGLSDMVKVYDLVPFRESVRRQKESSALLMLKWNDPMEKGVYTSKLFEYLGAKRPITAIGNFKDELIDNLLTESGAGIALDSVDTIKSVLSRWMDEWQKSGKIVSHWKPRADVIQRYTQRGQASKLAQLLEEASEINI